MVLRKHIAASLSSVGVRVGINQTQGVMAGVGEIVLAQQKNRNMLSVA